MNMDKNDQEVQTVTADMRPAPRRIATPQAAYNTYKRYRDSDAGDAVRRNVIQGMIDGNPPYDPQEMEDQGLSSCTNVNFMSMRANLDSRAAAAHELIMEVPTLVEIRPLLPDVKDVFMDDYCRIIAQEFSDMVMAWPGFQVAMDLSFREADAYGIGFCLWPDEHTWRPKAFKRGSLLFDPAASVDLTANDVYVIRDTMSAGDLLDKTENPQIARDEGWNITGIELILRKVFIEEEDSDGQDKYQRSTIESLQQMKRNNDPMYQSKQFQQVKIVHLLVREVSGERKVTHLIIPDSASNQVFLYEAPNRFDSMDRALWWLPFNYGDGFARSVRGVASWMAQHDDLSNRFLCRAFDAGFMSSSLLLQPRQAVDLGRLQFVQQGPYTIIPQDLIINQSSFQPQITQAIQLRNVSEDIMKNNTGMYRQNPETFGDGGIQKTARQVAEESSRDARMEKAAVTHRYNHLEFLYREMFRRAVTAGLKSKVEGEIEFDGLAEARRFIRRCLDRQVPRELLTNHEDRVAVTATRAIGMGSLGVRMDLTNQFLQVAGGLDAQGQVNVKRDWFAARVGQRNVDRYVKPYNRDLNPTSEHSFVALENNDLAGGQAVVVGADQLHKIHVLGHVQFMEPYLQEVEQGQVQDPMNSFKVLQVATQHLEGHFQYLAQDPIQRALVEELKPLFQRISGVLQSLMQMIKKLQAQQARQAQENQDKLAQADQVIKDRELEAKIYEINKKAEIEAMKQQSLNSMRAAKTQEQMQIAKERAAADIQLKAQRQAADIDIERQAAAMKGAGQ